MGRGAGLNERRRTVTAALKVRLLLAALVFLNLALWGAKEMLT